MEAEALAVTGALYARFIIGGVLLWAGISKLRQRARFAETTAALALMPRWLSSLVAQTVPLLEVMLGLFLIIGLVTRWAASIVLMLLSVFTIVVGILLLRRQPTRCACFGRPDEVINGLSVYRNVSLMLLSAFVLAVSRTPLSMDGLLHPSEHPHAFPLGSTLLASFLTALLAVIWLGIREATRLLAEGSASRGRDVSR